VSALGLADKVNYRTFSLSKAMVTRAGMVTGPARVMDFFRYEARPAIFSSAVLLYEVAGLGAALNVIQEEDWRRERLRSNTRLLRGLLAEAEFGVSPDGSQIIPLQADTEGEAIKLRTALEGHNLFSTIIYAPDAVGHDCFVRLLVNSSLVEEDIRQIVEICQLVRGESPVKSMARQVTI
jgi:CAI-1 autoinducer synthase